LPANSHHRWAIAVDWGHGSVHEVEREAAIFVRMHGLENALVSGLKLLQGDRTISIRID
jgi:hypothetical protein